MINQPHLLIAGTTGSGKSTLLHALIYTAIANNSHSKMILLDSKGIELYQYRNMMQCGYYGSSIPEQLHGLKIAYNTMMKCFQDMRKKGLKKTNKAPVYVIIDEYANLATSQYKKECLLYIQRICQLGRATNMHVWLSTQTPISKILSTEIKVNLDARIGLRTRSKQDSRNIIDKTGLETLPRYGIGYYMSPDKNGLFHVNMYSEEDIKKLIEYYKRR